MYPDDIQGWQLCYIEGCLGKGNCSRCGKINYHLMGYYDAIAKWAKVWKCGAEDAEKRMEANCKKKNRIDDIADVT